MVSAAWEDACLSGNRRFFLPSPRGPQPCYSKCGLWASRFSHLEAHEKKCWILVPTTQNPLNQNLIFNKIPGDLWAHSSVKITAHWCTYLRRKLHCFFFPATLCICLEEPENLDTSSTPSVKELWPINLFTRKPFLLYPLLLRETLAVESTFFKVRSFPSWIRKIGLCVDE